MASSQSVKVKEATQDSTENNSPLAVRETGYMRHQKKGFALLMTKPETGALLSAICVYCILFVDTVFAGAAKGMR